LDPLSAVLLRREYKEEYIRKEERKKKNSKEKKIKYFISVCAEKEGA